MPSCNILLAARASGNHSTSCDFFSIKRDAAIKRNIRTSRSTPDENVSTPIFTRSPPYAGHNPPSRTEPFPRADTRSYALLKDSGRGQMQHTSTIFWPHVSSPCSWFLMLYLILQSLYMTEQTSPVGIFPAHPSCRPPAHHTEKRSLISILPSSHRSMSCHFHRFIGGSPHLAVCPSRSWEAKRLPLFLPDAVQPAHNCCTPSRTYKKNAIEYKYRHFKCPLPRKTYRKNPAKSRHKEEVKKAVSFLVFPPRTHLLAQRTEICSYSLLRCLVPIQSNLCTTASTATVTGKQPGEQESLGEKQTAGRTEEGFLASSASVPIGAQGQFPFAYNGDLSDVLGARSNGPTEATRKALLRGNRRKSFVYFDNAATTQKPWSVLQALQRAYIHENANVHRSTYSRAAAATERLEGVRSQLAKYLNAEHPEEIVFTSGATDSINLVAGSWGDANISEGDEIVLSIAEHHSNIVPWQLLATRKNASLKYIQLNEQHLLSVPSLLSSLSPRTKLVALSHTSNVLGSFNPSVREVVRVIKQFNPSIVVLLDASQALAHHKLDVRDLLCDFLAGSGHKMYGPTGVGFLYGKHKLLQEMQPWKGGGEMIAISGLGAALDFVEQVGFPEIVAYESKLHSMLCSALEAYVPSLRLFCPPALPSPPPQLMGAVLPSKPLRKLKPLPPIPLISFAHPFVHAQDIATFLDVCDEIYVRSGHHCCQLLHHEALRVPATCRASLAVYNTEEEVYRFVKSAQSVITMLERQKVELCHATTDVEHLAQELVLPQGDALSLHSE